MQQTDKYKLNLIETSDPFSPSPLNENMEKVEAALTAVTAHADAGDAALNQRLQALELHKFVVGTYIGNGAKHRDFQIINLGFTPTAVIVSSSLHVPENNSDVFEIVPEGFKVTLIVPISGNATGWNMKNGLYAYIAFC